MGNECRKQMCVNHEINMKTKLNNEIIIKCIKTEVKSENILIYRALQTRNVFNGKQKSR